MGLSLVPETGYTGISEPSDTAGVERDIRPIILPAWLVVEAIEKIRIGAAEFHTGEDETAVALEAFVAALDDPCACTDEDMCDHCLSGGVW